LISWQRFRTTTIWNIKTTWSICNQIQQLQLQSRMSKVTSNIWRC